MIKAVILVGGPQKGTRFRPLSLDCPKPLFPVAGFPMIEHLIKACCEVPNMKEILLIGFYHLDEFFNSFINSVMMKFQVHVRYLQEYAPLGTAGGIYHFRDMIRLGDPSAVFLINGDICGSLNLTKMLEFFQQLPESKLIAIMATEATRTQSLEYGCIVEDKDSHRMLHYVEKPSSFVSTTISCGIYLFSLELLTKLANVFKDKHQLDFDSQNGTMPPKLSSSSLSLSTPTSANNHSDYCMSLETDVFSTLIDTKCAYVFHQSDNFWWSPIKSPGATIYANRNYLSLYRIQSPELLADNRAGGPEIVGNVYIHPSAIVHPTAKIGPNVSISEGASIGAGVRIRDAIILKNVTIGNDSFIMNAIVGWNCTIGRWSRVEGTPCDPNPDKAFAKMDNLPMFDIDGKLNPLITVLGCNVNVASELIVLNSLVLPHKEINRSSKKEIIL